MARSRCAASRGVGGAAPRTASQPTSPNCSPGSPPCRRRPSSRSTTKRSSGCTPGARALPCMCTATTVGPRRDPHLPSTAPTSSARASPTSCSPGSGPGPTSSCARCWAHTPAGSPPCMPGPAVGRRSRRAVSPRRVYLVVATAAAVVHLGVLWNGFALDDLTIIVANPLVHSLSGVWRAFAAPYFPANLDVSVYRPLTIATYALDWSVGATVWFHAVNLMWHVGASVLVALLARRWAGDAAGLVAGIVFAVHPVHVEAVANVVGRNELMAAAFTLLAVYAALERGSVLWSAAALTAGLLSKENAAVAPALVAAAWLLGVRPVPPRRRLAAFVVSWVVLAAAYTGVRWSVLHGFGGSGNPAPVFLGQGGLTGRWLAAVATLLLVLGGVRSAFRVGAWRDDRAATLALLQDAPRSYFSWQNLGWQYLRAGQFARAIGAFQTSSRIYPHDARVYIAAAHAAYALNRGAAADSLLTQADAACQRCVTYYINQASFARLRGDSASADSLVAHARRLRPS